MVRVRKLVLAIAAASALTSGMAQALGLGEVTLKSSLNQPLVAEIELLEVRDLASNELIPALASPEEFTKAGVDRQYFLTDLKFTPVLKPNGKSVIRVTSSKPVREPYLNFLVEVLWPNGRLLREYTVLLDPPLYAPSTAPAVAPQLPVAAPRAPVVAAPRPAAPAAPVAPRQPAPAPAPVAASPLNDKEYKTTGSDTLWEIAQRARAGGSVHQAMLAIQDLNPDAFVGGNINRLKSGQVLRLPDEQQIKSRAQGEAIAQVAEQNSAWREGRALAAGTRQLDATKRASAGAAPAEAPSKDSLKLVSAETGKSTAGSDKGGAGENKALSDKLAVTKESLDSTRRENDELKGRMGDLQGQLDKLQRLIQLKDDQLAKLQANMAAQNKAASEKPPAAATAAPAAPVAPVAPVAPKPVVEPAAAAPVQAAPPAVTPPATPPAEPDFNYQEPAASAAPEPSAQQPASEPAVAVVPVAPVVEKPAVPAPVKPAKPAQPVPAAEAPQEPSLVDQLLGNSMLLGVAGGGALLLLLVGLMVLSRRNALKEAELQTSLAGPDDEVQFDNDLSLEDGNPFDGSDDLLAETAQPGEERVVAQTGDALGEADIYIAYGRFNQAAELLQNAINDEPQRGDLRLKLMEVYAELGDRDGFARQESELREIGGSAADAESLKARYPAMASLAAGGVVGAAAADELDAFSLDDLILDEPVEQASLEAEDEFDLSLDELEAGLDADLQAEAAQQAASPAAQLDFSKPAADSASDDLDFDLSLGDEALGDDLADFSLDLDAGSKPAAVEEDDFLLSLEDEPSQSSRNELDDLSLELATDSAAAEFDLSDDFDLSLADETPAAAPATDSFAAQLDEVTAELDQLAGSMDLPNELDAFDMPAAAAPAPLAAELGDEDDFDFLSGTDETATKLDLARAYIDMGDTEGARDILDEVISEGSDGQQSEARELLARLV